MKKIILGLILVSSFSLLAEDKCVSDKKLDRKATAAKVLSTIGFGETKCDELKEMLSAEMCDDVKQETINYAMEVVDYMCDQD